MRHYFQKIVVLVSLAAFLIVHTPLVFAANLTLDPAQQVLENQATISGTLTINSGSLIGKNVIVYYSTSSGLADKLGVGTTITAEDIQNNVAHFSVVLAGLNPETTYYYQGSVLTSDSPAVAYSTIQFFKTLQSTQVNTGGSGNNANTVNNSSTTTSGNNSSNSSTNTVNGNPVQTTCEEGQYCLLEPLQMGDTVISQFDPATSIGGYLNIIFKIIIGIIGVLAVVMLILGGIQYMTTDVLTKKESGRETIKHAIGGLILALGAYLILLTINPNLVNLTLTIDKSTISVEVGYLQDQDGYNDSVTTGSKPGTATGCTGGLVDLPSTVPHVNNGKICKELLDKLIQLKNNTGIAWTITSTTTGVHSSSCHALGNAKSGNCADIALTKSDKTKYPYSKSGGGSQDPQWGALCQAVIALGNVNFANEASNQLACQAISAYKVYPTTTGANLHINYIGSGSSSSSTSSSGSSQTVTVTNWTATEKTEISALVSGKLSGPWQGKSYPSFHVYEKVGNDYPIDKQYVIPITIDSSGSFTELMGGLTTKTTYKVFVLGSNDEDVGPPFEFTTP